MNKRPANPCERCGTQGLRWTKDSSGKHLCTLNSLSVADRSPFPESLIRPTDRQEAPLPVSALQGMSLLLLRVPGPTSKLQ